MIVIHATPSTRRHLEASNGCVEGLYIIHRARSSLPIPPGNHRPNWSVTRNTLAPSPHLLAFARQSLQVPCLRVLRPPGPLRFEAVTAGFFSSFLACRAELSAFGRVSTTFSSAQVACTVVSPLDSGRFLFQLSPSTPCTSMGAVGVLGPA